MTTTDHAADMANDHAAEIDKHVRVYIAVFVALMVLTVVTVAISRLHLSVPVAVTVALLVATVKGALVACYFMHLISEKRLIYAVLVLTAVFFAALLALPAITHSNGFWIHS
jgi:cytochrome c oxidase subunit 4